MAVPLLSVAIPTYNRAVFLDRCLASFIEQLKESTEEVEILVSDNASTDGTVAVVNKYNEYYPISYVVNIENKGPDFNIAQAFDKANGKYVWVFGDDDFLIPGSLKLILNLLKQDDYGELFLTPLSYYSKDKQEFSAISLLDYNIYQDAIEFMNITTYWVTFITGNIINKNSLPEELNIYEFIDTNLVQVNWTIQAIFSGLKSVFVKTGIVACEQDNSGGYKYLKVFSVNYNKVLRALVNRGIDSRIVSITNKALIKNHLPSFIFKLMYTDNDYKNEKGFVTLTSVFWNYVDFWKIIFPIYVKFFIKKILFIHNKQ